MSYEKTIFTILFVLSVTINCMAQMTYKDGKLTVGRGMYKTYTTSWAGWAHYWGSTDQNGIKMHIHAADPRMSTTTNKLVFWIATGPCISTFIAARCIRLRMKN